MAVKTNERPGTRAVLRYCRMSSYKVREVLDLIRGMELSRALEILDHTDRAAAEVVAKLVRSAAANAEHNDGLDPEELYVASAYADEGATLKRWRPRARGRATRIRKRTCHITVVLARMPEEKLARKRAKIAAEATDRRARRVAGTRRQARAERTGEPQAGATRQAAAPQAGTASAIEDESPTPGSPASESPAPQDPSLESATSESPVDGAEQPAESVSAHGDVSDDGAADVTARSDDGDSGAIAPGEDAD